MTFKKSICCCSLLIAAALPGLATASDWSAGGGVQQFRAKLDGGTYSSYGLSLNAARWIKPGIGLSLDATIPVTSDQSDGLTFKVTSSFAAGLRLEGTNASSSGTAAHFTVGASLVNLDVQTNLETHNGNYSGIFVKGGLSFPAKFNTLVSIDYLHHWLDGDLRLDGFSVSFRRSL